MPMARPRGERHGKWPLLRRRVCGSGCLVGALVSELMQLGDFDEVAAVVAAVADCEADGCWAARAPRDGVAAMLAMTEAGCSVLPPAGGALPSDDTTARSPLGQDAEVAACALAAKGRA